jgi:hypothetical protein
MGTYTTQLSFGALQYERVQKWKLNEEKSRNTKWKKFDTFVRDMFMELLDEKIPDQKKDE